MRFSLGTSALFLLLLSACGENMSAGNFYTMRFALQSAVRCSSGGAIVAAGGSATVSFSGLGAQSSITVAYDPQRASSDPLGTIRTAVGSSIQVTYQAPSQISQNSTVWVQATDGVSSSRCVIHQVDGQSLGVADDGETNGLVGKVYQLWNGINGIPDFSPMNQVSQIVMANLDVPNRYFSTGFPGVPNLVEWFGIRFDGTIQISQAGTYDFALTSDDGARLYIDGQLVVNNDGTHAVSSSSGSVALATGKHSIRVDYYQGPAVYIALQLSWRPPGVSQWQIVPSSAFGRP